MRRNLVIAGGVVLVIGLILFFLIGPYLAAPAITKFSEKLNSTALKAADLQSGQTLNLGQVKQGQAFVFKYNDSAGVPLRLIMNGTAQISRINNTFLLVGFSTSSGNISLVNNYTIPLHVVYSNVSPVEISGFLGGIVGTLVGLVMSIAGLIVIAVGVILRPKPKAL
jgi:hypothetical protein